MNCDRGLRKIKSQAEAEDPSSFAHLDDRRIQPNQRQQPGDQHKIPQQREQHRANLPVQQTAQPPAANKQNRPDNGGAQSVERAHHIGQVHALQPRSHRGKKQDQDVGGDDYQKITEQGGQFSGASRATSKEQPLHIPTCGPQRADEYRRKQREDSQSSVQQPIQRNVIAIRVMLSNKFADRSDQTQIRQRGHSVNGHEDCPGSVSNSPNFVKYQRSQKKRDGRDENRSQPSK